MPLFSPKKENKIPKTLAECVKPNNTVVNLRAWVARLKRAGKILFFVLIAVGLITAVADAFMMMECDYYDYGYTSEESAFIGTLISTILNWALYAFIEYCTYNVLALLIDSLASITEHTIISARVALYTAEKAFGPDELPSSEESAPKSAPKTAVPAPAPQIPAKS